ncbi:MAG TPA: hypothetical protein VHU83_06000 [Bryobacteraceae bacterium]|jgi:hypothetical protein|nr:hypothetical protein [Bryobacteraceae bacterium]
MLVSELPASGLIGGCGLIAGCISRPDAPIDAPAGPLLSLASLAQQPDDAIFLLDENLRPAFNESLACLWPEFAPRESTLVILVPHRPAPRTDPHVGKPVSSFLCSSDLFRRYLALEIDCAPQALCFTLLESIASNVLQCDRLLVRSLPHARVPPAPLSLPPIALLMPHRGDPGHLEAALLSLSRAGGEPLHIRVGLDVEDASAYRRLAVRHPSTEFFCFHPPPVGPYVIRQALAERSSEPWLSLQDSDDISCHDRFPSLLRAMCASGCGITGSQELCLDEMRRIVFPVRYPLNPSATLAERPSHALLHASLMARRGAFFESGGLSTHYIIANDTQFLLRLFFSTEIRNVDEFLYIRRRHATSLTNAPETVHDNPLRRRLSAEWCADFDAIKRGELKLADSSLRPIRRSEPYAIESLC